MSKDSSDTLGFATKAVISFIQADKDVRDRLRDCRTVHEVMELLVDDEGFVAECVELFMNDVDWKFILSHVKNPKDDI